MDTNKLPIEVGLEKAKFEILQAINQVGRSYDLPSSFVMMIVEQLLIESKLNTYQTIITHYDIDIPKGVEQNNVVNSQPPLENDDVIMKPVDEVSKQNKDNKENDK